MKSKIETGAQPIISEKAKGNMKKLDSMVEKLHEIEDFTDELTQAYIVGVREHMDNAIGLLSNSKDATEEIRQAAIEITSAGKFAEEHEFVPDVAIAFFETSKKLYNMIDDNANAKASEELADGARQHAKQVYQLRE